MNTHIIATGSSGKTGKAVVEQADIDLDRDTRPLAKSKLRLSIEDAGLGFEEHFNWRRDLAPAAVGAKA